MYFETLKYFLWFISPAALVFIVLNLILIMRLRKINKVLALKVLGLFGFNVLLNISDTISFAGGLPIVSLIFILSSLGVTFMVMQGLESKLRYSLLGLPILYMLIYFVNVFLIGGDMGISLFSRWIA